MIEFGNLDHGRTIAKAIPRLFNPEGDRVISNVTDDGRLRGGVIFDGHTGPCIFIHQAGFDPFWMNRDMLWVTFDYVFNQCSCSKVVGTIPSGNPKLLALNLKLGFKVETKIEGAYPFGADMLILSMKRDECRWLALKPRNLRAGH